jgi:parvulin-like peptidyl-prolyl isomerase
LGYEADAERERQTVGYAIGCQMTYQREIPRDAALRNRRAWLRDYLVQKEALIPIYNSITPSDRLEFYDRNRAEFMTAARVTLSEIFLQCEDSTRSGVQRWAQSLVEQLRNGLSFGEAVQLYTPPNRASYSRGGSLGSFRIDELRNVIAGAISSLEPGGITDPIGLQDGFMIVRLDGREDPRLLGFEDPRVQESISRAITMDRAEAARKAYIARRLREEAVVSVLSNF